MPIHRRSVVHTVLAALFLLTAAPLAGGDIPAFARKYKVGCGLCHTHFPRLNAFGAQFAANGFTMARGQVGPDTVTTGDPWLRLQRELPLAVRVEGYLSSLTGKDAVTADLKTPWGIKLLSGGQIADNVSYYMYFFLTERGEVAGLEDAFLQFGDVFGSGVAIAAGQFQLSDPLYKRELRLEYEDYMPYRVRVGDVRTDLTYERGIMASRDLWGGSELFVQVVNGRGLDQATADLNYSTQTPKNLGVRLSQDFGLFRLGGYTYLGKEKLADGTESVVQVWGPDATVPLGRMLELNVQYLYRRDGNPFFLDICQPSDPRCDVNATHPLRTSVNAYMGELLFAPSWVSGRLIFTGLYNRVQSDRPVFTLRVGEPDYLKLYESAGVTAHYLSSRNLRFMAEVNRDLQRNRFRFTTGVVTAF